MNIQYFYSSWDSINKTNLFRSLRHSSVVSAGSREYMIYPQALSLTVRMSPSHCPLVQNPIIFSPAVKKLKIYMILIYIISKLLDKIIRAFRNVLLNSCIVSKESLVKDQVCQVREFPGFARCEISAAMMVVGLHYIYVYIFYSISIFHIDFISSRTIFTVFTLGIF